MKTGTVYLAAIWLLVTGCDKSNYPSRAPQKLVTNNYYGVEISDPYRYMENMDDTVFLSWLKEYASYSRDYLDNIPGREELISQMVEFDERRSEAIHWLAITENGRYFYLKMTPEDQKPSLYTRESYEAEEYLIYDPDDFAPEEEANYLISDIFPIKNGKYVGISLAPNGSESSTLIIYDVENRQLLRERIEQITGHVAWIGEGLGFLYGRTNSDDVHDPDRFLNTKVYYHMLGTRQSSDRVVFSSEMYPEVNMKPEELPYIISEYDDGNYFLILRTVERYLRVFHAQIPQFSPGLRNIQWRPVIFKDDKIQGFASLGDTLYAYTARNKSGFELLKTSLKRPDFNAAEVVLPEPENGLISGIVFTNEAIYYSVKVNGVEEHLYRKGYGQEKVENIELPDRAGTLVVSSRGHKFPDIWIGIYGWTRDGKRYRYLPEKNSFIPEPLSSTASFPEYEDLVVEELLVPSHDGTKVPLSLIYREGTRLDGSARLLITGYGAYGSSRKPVFNPYMLMWTLKGGIYAVAHVRGGGELGDEWRLGGHKETKPNTWKDFNACTEYLVEHKYTSNDRIAAYGGSAGGILVGRAMIERPELYAAVISLVGVMNPLRVEQSPNGPVNAPEFGTVNDSTECMSLIEMDPYVQLEEGKPYPATLVTAGFNDPRVIIWQPAKYAARLQEINQTKKPVIFDVDYSSGHGVGNTKEQEFEDLADLFSFALRNTGHPDYQ